MALRKPQGIEPAPFLALLLSLIFSLLFVYSAIGILPISAVEGDGLGIANGAAQIAEYGRDDTSLAYRYSVQSGTYALVVLIHKLTGADTFTTLSLVSALSSMLFVLVSAAFLRRMTGYPFAGCGLVVLLFQEAFTSGYYGNSTVIAAFFLVMALWVLARDARLSPRGNLQLVMGGILLGMGIWMRFDLILVTPAIFLLLHRGAWKETFMHTGLVALVTMAVSFSAIYLSGSSISAILFSADMHRIAVNEEELSLRNLLLDSSDIRSHITFFTLFLCLFIALGVLHVVRKGDWRTLGISLLGTLPFYIAYLGAVTTPKYLYYLIPFAALLVLSAVSELKPHSTKHLYLRTFALLTLVTLFVVQYIIGWQVSTPARPYLRESSPTFLTLFSTSTPLKSLEQLSLVIGAGSSVTTADGRRLLSGIAFAPLFQYHQKTLTNLEVESIDSYLDNAREETGDAPLNLLTTQYTLQQLLLNLLLDDGYGCQLQDEMLAEEYDRVVCTKDGHEVNLVSRQIGRLEDQQANRAIDAMVSAIHASEIAFLSANPREQNLLRLRAEKWKKINNYTFELDLKAP